MNRFGTASARNEGMADTAPIEAVAPPPDDTELIRRIRAGDRAAFTALTKRFEEKVFSLALKITGNSADAQEIAQDVFLTVYLKLDSFRGESAFSSWLYRITANTAFMRLRDRRKRRAASYDGTDANDDGPQPFVASPADPAALADEQLVNIEAGAKLLEAVSQLPEPFKLVFLLKDVGELSNEEVSNVVNVSLPAAKSRLHRARQFLRARLTSYREGAV